MRIDRRLIQLRGMVKVIALRIRYGKRLSVSFVQAFEGRLHVKLQGNSKLVIGKNTGNSGDTYLTIVDGVLEIGECCFFNKNCNITVLDYITIGSHCTFGQNVVIVDHDHNIYSRGDHFLRSPIHIGDNSWIGANCVILKGVTIGKNSVIAAGTVVTRDVPENTILYQKRENVYREKRDNE